MTTPIFGTDPLSGANYNLGQKLQSAHMNDALAWMRNLDSALEHAVVQNWPFYTTPAIGAAPRLAYDASLGIWILGGDNAAAPEMYISYDNGATWDQKTPTNVSVAASIDDVTTDGAGVVVGACDDGTMRRCANITAAAPTWTEPAPGGAATDALFWDDKNSLFQHLEGGRGVSRSADGTAWTRQATGLPASFAGKTMGEGATDAGSSVVVVTVEGHDKCATSTDGIAWTERSMPVSGNWNDVTWHSGDSKFFSGNASLGAGSMASSPDAITWTTVTPTSVPIGTAHFNRIRSSGNLLVVNCGLGAGDGLLIWSEDSGLTWYGALDTGPNATDLEIAPGADNGMSFGTATSATKVWTTLRIVD